MFWWRLCGSLVLLLLCVAIGYATVLYRNLQEPFDSAKEALSRFGCDIVSRQAARGPHSLHAKHPRVPYARCRLSSRRPRQPPRVRSVVQRDCTPLQATRPAFARQPAPGSLGEVVAQCPRDARNDGGSGILGSRWPLDGWYCGKQTRECTSSLRDLPSRCLSRELREGPPCAAGEKGSAGPNPSVYTRSTVG